MSAPFGPGCPWYGLYERFGAPNVDWCEPAACAWINEPVNAWSNLAYMLPAAWLFVVSRGERRRVALAGFVMGALSFLYHGTNNLLTQYGDFFGMYVWAAYLIALRARRLSAAWRSQTPYWLLVALLTGITPLLHAAGVPFQGVVALLAVVLLALELKTRAGDGRLILGAALAFSAGALFSLADVTRFFCRPESLVQGHALWHLCGGVGMTLLTLYHRDERCA